MNEEILKELKVQNRLLAAMTVVLAANERGWKQEAINFLAQHAEELLERITKDCMTDQSQ